MFTAVQILTSVVSQKRNDTNHFSYRSLRCLRRLHCFESFLLSSNLCSFHVYHFFELDLTFFVGFCIHITALTFAIGIGRCVSPFVEMVIELVYSTCSAFTDFSFVDTFIDELKNIFVTTKAKDFFETKKNESGTTPNSFSNNLIFNLV